MFIQFTQIHVNKKKLSTVTASTKLPAFDSFGFSFGFVLSFMQR